MSGGHVPGGGEERAGPAEQRTGSDHDERRHDIETAEGKAVIIAREQALQRTGDREFRTDDDDERERAAE